MKGRTGKAPRCLFYGPEGVGKSSLAADAPDTIFLNIEDGLGELDCARYPFRDSTDADNGEIPYTLAEVYAALDDLIASEHSYKNVAIDTIDSLESRLLWPHVVETRGDGQATGIESFGYGKGYTFALEEWRVFLSRLDRLRRRGIGIILLGHALVRPFKNPEGEDYDRYQLKLHDKAAGLLKEWCDVVGFMRFEGGAQKLSGDKSLAKRARGWSSGRRLLHLERTAAWDAKSRLSLPTELEIERDHPWAPFAQESNAATETSDADVRSLIEAELEILGDTFTGSNGKPGSATQVRSVVKTADRPTLDRILSGLRASEPTGGTNDNQEH